MTKALRLQEGFTLIELVLIVLIIGILASVAIPKYIDLKVDAQNGAARGILGALRSANSIIWAKRIAGSHTTAITGGDILSSANLDGVQATAATTIITITLSGGETFEFTVSSTDNIPTDMPIISAATTTW